MFIEIIKKIRPSVLQSLVVKIIFGNHLKRRKLYFLKKRKIFLYIDPFNFLGTVIIKDNDYEKEVLNFVVKNINQKSIFLDVGANEGIFSIIASKKNINGKTYAFEPQKLLISVIKKNLRVNQIKNCKIINAGLGSGNFKSYINLYPDLNTGASSIIRPYRFSNKKQSINISSLDYFIKKNNIIGKIDLIKIDVEGYEIQVIKGMKNLLKNNRIKNILVDYHMNIITLEDKNNCEQFIISCGYKKKKFNSKSGFVYYALNNGV